MENQHRQIKGYRELSQEEIDLMNEIKEKGAALGEIVEKLEVMQHKEVGSLQAVVGQDDFPEKLRSLSEAREWVREGKMELKRGLMALTRAVARPTFF